MNRGVGAARMFGPYDSRAAAAAYAGAPSPHPDAHLTARAVYEETESNSQTIWGAEELARRVDAACGRPGLGPEAASPRRAPRMTFLDARRGRSRTFLDARRGR